MIHAGPGLLVVRDIDGRTLVEADLRVNLARIAALLAACRREMKVASALREAMWGMVSAIHLAVPGADYPAHVDDDLVRTEAALAGYRERHGALPG